MGRKGTAVIENRRQVGEFVYEGERALIAGNYMTIDLRTLAGKLAARTYAYQKIAEGEETLSKSILQEVDRCM